MTFSEVLWNKWISGLTDGEMAKARFTFKENDTEVTYTLKDAEHRDAVLQMRWHDEPRLRSFFLPPPLDAAIPAMW